MTSDLPGRNDREPDPMSLPDASRRRCSTWSATSPATRPATCWASPQRGVREISMMQAKGFSPTGPWTAQDVADHADEVFFAEESVTAVGLIACRRPRPRAISIQTIV